MEQIITDTVFPSTISLHLAVGERLLSDLQALTLSSCKQPYTSSLKDKGRPSKELWQNGKLEISADKY